MKLRHSFFHFFPHIIVSVFFWVALPPVAPVLTVILIVDAIIVRSVDYLMLTDSSIEGRVLTLFPKLEIQHLSSPRSRIRSCDVHGFLFWNTVMIRGPYGVVFTMKNVKHSKQFVSEIKSRWR